MTATPQHRKPRPGFPVAVRGRAGLVAAGAPFEDCRRPGVLGRCMAKVRHLLPVPRQRCTHNQIAYKAQPALFTHANKITMLNADPGSSFKAPSRLEGSLGVDSGFSKYAKSANWAGDNREQLSALIRSLKEGSPGRRLPSRCISSMTTRVSSASNSSAVNPGGGGNL